MAEPALDELKQLEPDVTIKWRAFELRPDPVPLLDPQGDYLTSVWRDHVYPLAQRMDMPLQLPPMQPRSRLAHEAAKWAGSHNRFDDYNMALFKAFFQFGLDIGKTEVLEKLAADIGLDATALSSALNGKIYTVEVVSDQEEAKRIGVRAVPAFAVDGRVIASGMQRASTLRNSLRLQRL